MEAAETAGVRLMCNENFIFRPWIVAARQVIDSGELGQLTFMALSQKSAIFLPGREKNDGSYRASDQYKSDDRFMLLESGPHVIEIVRHLFGDPVSVFTRTLALPEIARGDVMATISLGYLQPSGDDCRKLGNGRRPQTSSESHLRAGRDRRHAVPRGIRAR